MQENNPKNDQETTQEQEKQREKKILLLFVAIMLSALSIAACAACFYCVRGALLFGQAAVTIWQCATRPDPDVPVIRSAEFPITVTYEHDGEVRTIHDTLVCEYEGYIWRDSDLSLHRNWSARLEGGKYITLFQGGEHYGAVLFVDCSAAWMMGDKEEAPADCGEPSYLVGVSFGEREEFYPSDEDEFYRDMGIKVLDFQIAPPIENTFVPPEPDSVPLPGESS